MKKLQGMPGFSRRDFLKAAGFALVLPAIDGCAATIPRTGTADSYSETLAPIVNIHGTRVKVLYPRGRLDELRRASRGFLQEEIIEDGAIIQSAIFGSYVYNREDLGDLTCDRQYMEQGMCEVPGEVFRGSRVYSTRYLAEYIITGRNHELTFIFAEGMDRGSPTPGTRRTDAAEFASLVREVSGQEVRKVEIIVDQASPHILVSAHVIPVSQNGEIISRYDIGVLALGFSFHPEGRTYYSGISLLVEQ